MKLTTISLKFLHNLVALLLLVITRIAAGTLGYCLPHFQASSVKIL